MNEQQRITGLTPIAQVLARVAALAHPVAPRELALADAEGRVLAADVIVTVPLPSAPIALTDGWAVRADQVTDAGPYAPVLLDPAPRWVDAGAARQATYTNLPPRDYQFRVMASGGDGNWGQPSTSLTFGIQPMFYQTPWFYLVCGLSVFLVVYLSWRVHVRQVRRQFALVLAERIRMSRAIHDTLLQGLAALALQVDDLSHTDLSSQPGRNRILAIRRQVEGYIRQARRSILDLRAPTLATGDLPQALRDAAELAIGGRPVALDVTVKGTPHACAASVEEQLVLIGQEAVNNAVRHGQASRVSVEIDYRDDQTFLRVADDGVGFEPEAAARASGHYGLVSMRERAEQVRGRITIASRPGSGTEIETVVPA